MNTTRNESDRRRELVSPEGIPFADYDVRGLARAHPHGAV